MKDFIKKYYLGFITVLVFTSCVATGTLPNLRADVEAHEPGKSDFIELNDGSVLEGAISEKDFSRLSDGITIYPITINGASYKVKEIQAFQSQKKYYRKGVNKKFHERIVKGKLNLYRHHQYGTPGPVNGPAADRGTRDYDLFFLQKGDKEPIVDFEIAVLKKMVEDYQPAVDELNKYYALSKSEKKLSGDNYLNNVIYAYNNRK